MPARINRLSIGTDSDGNVHEHVGLIVTTDDGRFLGELTTVPRKWTGEL